MQERIGRFRTYVKERANPSSPFLYLFAPNHIKTIIAYFGAIQAGFVVVPINPRIGSIELQEMLEDTPPSVIVRPDAETVEFSLSDEFEFHTVDSRAIAWDELGGDVCTIVYTNAADGYAKGAMLTRENLMCGATAVALYDAIGEDTVSWSLLPWDTLYGFVTGVLIPSTSGGGIVCDPIGEVTMSRRWAERIKRLSVTHVYSAPLIYYLLARVPDLSLLVASVKTFVSGGYRLSERIADLFASRSGRAIHEGYGLTEASPFCTWHRPGDKLKCGSVGRPLGYCSLRVCDDNGQPLIPGVEGAVMVSGPHVMKGYYGCRADRYVGSTPGWLATGDVGYLDNDGYLFLRGNSRQMVNVAGRKAFVREIERLALQMPSVTDIRVWGEDSDVFGQVLHAHVATGPAVGQNALLHVHEWMRRNLSPHKVPRFLHSITD